MQHLPITLQSCQVLIIGWGRIGAALAEDLKKNGAQVTVCSGTERSRSLCMALGYGVFPPEQASVQLPHFRVIVNTAPAVTISDFSSAQKNCLFIDLASKPGIIAPEVIAAKGLPGKMVPESSGKLIAKAVQHIIFGKE